MTSVPRWPRFVGSGVSRVLAWYDGRTIITEYGEAWPAVTLDEVRDRAFSDNLLIFMRDVGAWDGALDAMGDNKCQVSMNRTNGIVAVRMKKSGQGNRTRWLIRSTAWSESTGPGLLLLLRSLFTYCQMGDCSTPSALGQALMRAKHTGLSISRPSRKHWKILKDNVIGGRVDTLTTAKEVYECLYELDMFNAYANSIRVVPVGTSGYMVGEPEPRMVTGFYKCTWSVPASLERRLRIAPLAVRLPDGMVTYPTEGAHAGWYWWEEVQAARSLGIQVTVHEGLYWRALEPVFDAWADHMEKLRAEAPAELAGLIKVCTVAAIGRFAQDRVFYEPVADPDYEVDKPLIDPISGIDNPWYMREVERDCPELQIQLNSYAMMKCRLALFIRAMFEDDCLVATNYDAVYTTRRPEQTEGIVVNGWKMRRHTRAVIAHPRWLESDQVKKRPGLQQRQ